MNDLKTLILVTLLVLAGRGPQSRAQEDTMKQPDGEPVTYWNLKWATFGGKQFWTDVVHLRGYRIQQNALSGHYRLLDPSNRRLSWGNWSGCREELDRVALEKGMKPVDGRVVIVLHGLSRTRSAMRSISDFLEHETDLHVVNLSYASGRGGLEQHAAALESVIRNLPEATEIDFVGHSLGNIVVRYYLGTRGHDPRFRRMVMLAPPNHGSALARILQSNVVFRTVTGESGQQMAGQWEQIREKLATPEFEFAIIAGASGRISNPVIGGSNDLVVKLEETRLAGARDFWQGEFWHSTIMNEEAVHRATANFIEHGWLRSEDERQPIEEDLAAESSDDEGP